MTLTHLILAVLLTAAPGVRAAPISIEFDSVTINFADGKKATYLGSRGSQEVPDGFLNDSQWAPNAIIRINGRVVMRRRDGMWISEPEASQPEIYSGYDWLHAPSPLLPEFICFGGSLILLILGLLFFASRLVRRRS